MPKYFITIPNSVTLPTDGNKVALTSACELHRDDSGVPNALTVAAAGAYNMFVADAPGTGTATAPDVTAPTLLSTSPADNATGVAVGATIDLVFSETVVLGTGNIVLRANDGGWAALESFNAATGTGDNGGTLTLVTTTETDDTVRITPGASLANSIEHAVQVAATAVVDTATSPNAFAGIADDTTVSFTTEAAAGGSVAVRGTNKAAGSLFGTTPSIPLPAGLAEGDFVIVTVGTNFLDRAPSSVPAWLTYQGTIIPWNLDSSNGTWQRVYTGNAPVSPPATADFTFAANGEFTGVSIAYVGGTLGNIGTDDSAEAPVASLTTTGITVLANSAVAVIATTSNQNLVNMNSTPTALELFAITHSQTKSHLITSLPNQSAGTSDTAVIDADSGDSATTRMATMSIEVRS